MSDETLKALQESQAAMTKQMEALQSLIGQQGQVLANTTQTLSAMTERLTAPPPKPAAAAPDFNEMGSGDIAQFLLTEMQKMQTETKNDLQSKLDESLTSVSKRSANEEIERFAEKNPSFGDFMPEISALAKENPGLSLPRLFALAKVEHPEKAAEVEAKYAPKDDKKDTPAFTGLTPTSTNLLAAGDDQEKGDLSLAEGMQRAWESTVGSNLDAVLSREDPLA